MNPFAFDKNYERLRGEMLHYKRAYEKHASGKAYLELKEQLEKSEKRVAFHKEKAERLNADLKQAKLEPAQLRGELKALTKRVRQLEKTVADKDAEIAAKDAELAAKDAELAELREKADKLDEVQEQNRKLKASLAKDSGNSSFPSSQERPWQKRIQNNREKSGRKRGGQPGHKGHARQIPDGDIKKNVDLFIDDERIAREGLTPTDKVIEKRVVDIVVLTRVTTYRAHVYVTADGKEVHAPFPAEVSHNEMCYSPALKAFLYYLIVSCNVSVRNAAAFISHATGGRLNPSTGFVQSLMEEFSAKSQAELSDIFSSLFRAPTMNVDFTGTRVDGHGKQVIVCCNKDFTLYQMKDHKGHEGIKGTPLEFYEGLVYHDHDKTFYSYGGDHQECLIHIRRYLKGVIELEPDRPWAKKMLALIDEFLDLDELERIQMTEARRQEFKARYSKIAKAGLADYAKNPPSDWIRDGFNLARRLWKFDDSTLAFLDDPLIEKDNNRAERALRTFKRKFKQMTGFRSDDGCNDICAGLSVIETLKASAADVHAMMMTIFARPQHQRRKRKTTPQPV